MKILLANKYHYLKGGADAVFFNTSKLLEDNGHIVIPFCTLDKRNIFSKYENFFVDAPEIREQTIFVKFMSVKRFIWNNKATKQLERLIEAEKPDIAHLHNVFNGLSLSILPVLKKYRIPVVVTIHDTRYICPSSYFNTRIYCDNCLKWGGLPCGIHRCYQDDFINSWMCAFEMFHKEKCFNYDKYIDKYIFVSKRFMNFHSQRHSWFEDKGTVLYNFLPEQNQIKVNNKKGQYFFYYGRITVEKGVLTLIEAISNMPSARLILAGNGPLLETLKKKELSNVFFVGFKSGKELFEFVSNASFVIVPSECEENNPMTIIEAYSYGIPVIGAKIGGIPEIIIDGDTGFTFEAFSKTALEEAIRKAQNVGQKEYEKMSRAARTFAEQYFSPEKHYERLMDIYNQVLEK